jgi:hypothetical protein
MTALLRPFNLVNSMKTILLLALLALSALSAPFCHAQSYSITSAGVDSGGGITSGGAYVLSGSIAPLGWQAATGGSYSLSGGLFAQYMALQRTGAPFLSIRRSGAHVQVVWGSHVPGWVLQSNISALAPGGWVDVAGPPTMSGAEQYHQFSAGSGPVFYRLRKL